MALYVKACFKLIVLSFIPFCVVNAKFLLSNYFTWHGIELLHQHPRAPYLFENAHKSHEFCARICLRNARKDIDECLTQYPCRSGQRCTNTNGSYRCEYLLSCSGGYEPNVQGSSCVGEYTVEYICAAKNTTDFLAMV